PPSVPTYPADSSNGTPQVRADHTPGDPEPEAASRSPLEGRCPMRLSCQGVMAAYATPKRREKGVVAKTPHPMAATVRRPMARPPIATAPADTAPMAMTPTETAPTATTPTAIPPTATTPTAMGPRATSP